jgi:hypothetical protein
LAGQTNNGNGDGVSREILEDGWLKDTAGNAEEKEWLRGPATPRRRQSLILPYRFELIWEGAA